MCESVAKRIAVGLEGEPELAIVAFAERMQNEYVDLDLMTEEDSLFTVRFVERFIAKYSIDIDISFNRDYSLKEQANGVIDSILSHKPRLFSRLIEKTVENDIEDALDEFEFKNDAPIGLAHLNATEKRAIHEHIARIREIIEASNLSDRKKNALFGRLNALSKEVDQRGTRTDRFFAFMGDIAFVVGEMAKEAKPLSDEVKEMVKIVSRSRARREGISLRPGDEALKLPADE